MTPEDHGQAIQDAVRRTLDATAGLSLWATDERVELARRIGAAVAEALRSGCSDCGVPEGANHDQWREGRS